MSHIGLVSPAYTGHLNPWTQLGRELRRRGHRVTLITTVDGRAAAAAADLEFVAVGVREFPHGSVARFAAEQGTLVGLPAIEFMSRHIAANTVVLFRELPSVIADAAIDALLVDELAPAGSAVASRLGLPHVTISMALPSATDLNVPPQHTTWDYRPSAYGRWRNRRGYRAFAAATAPVTDAMAVHGFGHDVGLAQIIQLPAFFDFPRRDMDPRCHYTGPFHRTDLDLDRTAAFRWELLDGRPLVYASMGTLQNRLPWIFPAIAETCAALDIQLVIAAGGDPSILGRLPGDPIVVPYAPQLALLARASLLVTHAGANTALQALAAGVPMVALPVTNDQPGVAARIRFLGAGELIPARRVTARRLTSVVRRIRADSSYAANARFYASRLADIDGVGDAADIVDEALRTGRPVERVRPHRDRAGA